MGKILYAIVIGIIGALTLQSQTPPAVYVAADGTGDYQCDGVGDQVEINQALDFVAAHAGYNTVHLKGPHTYIIDDPILISNDCKLIADSGVVVRVQDSVNWPVNKPVIGQKGAEYWQGGEHESSLVDQIYGQSKDSLRNVEIAGFEITAENQDASSGSWYYILMLFHKVRNLNVHNMYLHDNFGDFICIMGDDDLYSRNVHIHHNRMMHSGHDGLYFEGVDLPEIDHNIIEHTRTNDGIRLEECRHVNVHDNVVGNSLTRVPSGYAGIILENDDVFVESGEIFGNFIYGKAGGIVLRGGPVKEYMQNIRIHHNRIYQTFDNTAGGDHFLNGAIHLHDVDQTLIEFNTIEGSQKDGVVFELTQGTESGYQTVVRNNIIAHCANYGINNSAPNDHQFIIAYNDLFDCQNGYYNQCSGTGDIHADPLFAQGIGTSIPGEVDLHLKSRAGRLDGQIWTNDIVSSPCIDAGDPASDYTSEPQPNGARVNLGTYGNTPEASKSDETAGITNVPADETHVYPNPTSGKIYVSRSGTFNTYSLYDLDGKLLLQGNISNDTPDISRLANGIYLLQLVSVTSGKSLIIRIVKN